MNFTITKPRISAIAEILRDAGQVFLASILVEPLIGQSANWLSIISGITLSIFCWIVSLLIIK